MEVTVTPSAEKFIRRLLRFDGGPGSGFRLRVTAGGCSGLAAEFSVEASPLKGDAVVEVNGMKLFLPAESRLLLDGVTIDFADTCDTVRLCLPRSEEERLRVRFQGRGG